MADYVNFGICCLVALATVILGKPVDDQKDVQFTMPGVQPQAPDTYLCTPMKMPEKPTYITGFIPEANKSTAHHILIYGCTEPGEEEGQWNCGEMQAVGSAMEQGPVCQSGAKIIYAWAMDAPPLHLPEDVGFKVGGDTGINYLVLQVHYKDVTPFVEPNDEKDHSGVKLITTTTPQSKTAGVYLMGTGGEIAPHSTVYMETACSFNDPIVIHPFAFRTHAHTHGEVVSGYRVRDGEWTELGRMSPKKPQMFYNVSHPGITVKNGDILAARCTMVNDEERSVPIGSTQQDEMCNFYLMYWVDGDKIMSSNYCFTAGPPDWDWSMFSGLDADQAPLNASMIPGTDKLLKASFKLLKDTENAFANMNGMINDDLEQMIDGWKDGPLADRELGKYDPFGLDEYALEQAMERNLDMTDDEPYDSIRRAYEELEREYYPEDNMLPY
jgi:peptidylglycine monooxygenase